MRTLSEMLPGAKTIARDDAETQYLVSFDRGSFWLDLPTGKDPASPKLIFVFSGKHGSGERNNLTNDGSISRFRRDMLAAGFGFVCAVCSPIAFGSPESTEATLNASRYCRARGLNVPDRLALLGFSMGGLGALMFAARHPEKTGRVVDCFGITDSEDFFQEGGGTEVLGLLTPEERAERSPLRHCARYSDIPVMIVHGDRDSCVNISYSERLYAALKRQGSFVRFLVVPGYGHEDDTLTAVGGPVKEFFEADEAFFRTDSRRAPQE